MERRRSSSVFFLFAKGAYWADMGSSPFGSLLTQSAQTAKCPLMSENDRLAPTLEERLIQQFGELIELNELAELLRYPSALALKRAVLRGKLEIELSKVGSRKVAATREVARLLVASGVKERPGAA